MAAVLNHQGRSPVTIRHLMSMSARVGMLKSIIRTEVAVVCAIAVEQLQKCPNLMLDKWVAQDVKFVFNLTQV